MAHFDQRRYVIGGKPRIVMSGEVHYFRLTRREWEDRIQKAKAANCNAIASYIPWLFHEEVEGDIDVTGRKSPEHDLGAFIDLCADHGLWFIARPGPFTMGEIKNEGLPYWIYTKAPECIPVTWEGKKVTSKTVSYNHPSFLKYVRRWYGGVMPVLASRLDSHGGNLIAVQLDNEIGMLQCWTEEADLSEDMLCDFTTWVQSHYPGENARERYGFDLADPFERAKHLRAGDFPQARAFHVDYTRFTRARFSQYVRTLRGYAEENGVRNVPFVVNIHGSGGGRATTFPIGISQTFESYTQDDGYWGSSDHYLGDITRDNVGDLVMLNCFMAAVNRPNQPLSSIEFEAGTGDYGETGGRRYSGAATDFKVRLSIAQGNRMLNHYLLAGGHNPPLERKRDDGNDRLGTTGGRHGFAAPIGPEGQLDPVYHALAETNRTVMAVGDLLATSEEEHDAIHLGFVPDYYSTDVKRPGPMRAFADAVTQARGFLESMVRNMVDQGLSFTGVNLQASIPADVKAIALACSPVLDTDVQKQLMDFVQEGGNLLLMGRVPVEDHEGRPATLLRDTLGLKPLPLIEGSPDRFPSLQGVGLAADEPEFRVWQVQPFEPVGEAIFEIVGTRHLAGALITHGRGKVLVLTTEIPHHRLVWRKMLGALNVSPGLSHDDPLGGLVINRLRCDGGARFISLINLDDFDKKFRISDGIQAEITLSGRTAKLLPYNVNLVGIHVLSSTTEIVGSIAGSVGFRQTAHEESVLVKQPFKTGPGARVARIDEDVATVVIAPGTGEVWLSRS